MTNSNAYPRLEDALPVARWRTVAGHLLKGDSDKEIAEAIGSTAAATHHVVTRILKRTGCDSRARFIAKYLPARVLEESA